jgi:hypothetical protein
MTARLLKMMVAAGRDTRGKHQSRDYGYSGHSEKGLYCNQEVCVDSIGIHVSISNRRDGLDTEKEGFEKALTETGSCRAQNCVRARKHVCGSEQEVGQ